MFQLKYPFLPLNHYSCLSTCFMHDNVPIKVLEKTASSLSLEVLIRSFQEKYPVSQWLYHASHAYIKYGIYQYQRRKGKDYCHVCMYVLSIKDNFSSQLIIQLIDVDVDVKVKHSLIAITLLVGLHSTDNVFFLKPTSKFPL